MKVFKTKTFSRWAKKEKVTDELLRKAVEEMLMGLVDADLGGGLMKKRVARVGQGKRGGHRMLVAFKCSDRSIFIFGFSKNDREDIDDEEKHLYKQLAYYYLTMDEHSLAALLKQKKLFEVDYEKAG